MAAPERYRAVRLAGQFPAGLNTDTEDTDLEANETPDGYGFDVDAEGLLKKGTIPSGTARVQKTILLGTSAGEAQNSTPYLWHYKRLWNITNRTLSTASTVLTFGAMDYNDKYYRQGLGRIEFDEDANTILAFVPFEPDSAVIAKATGSYVMENLSDTRAFFRRSDLIQEMAVAAANQIIELGNVVYVTNTNGLIGYQSGKAAEVSKKVRGETLTGSAITADHKKQRLVIGTTFAYDLPADKWFKYSGSSFRFTSRRLHSDDWAPFAVDRLSFVVDYGTVTDGGDLTYQIRYEDEDWSDEFEVLLPYEDERFTVVDEDLDARRSSRRFQIRLTGLTSGIGLRDILVWSRDGQFDDYSA